MLNISRALRLSLSPSVAFVGAGGKTSAIFQSARELAPVLVSTSTHLGEWQAEFADNHFIWEANMPMPELKTRLGSGITLVTGMLDSKTRRYLGLTLLQLEELRSLAGYHDIPLLIEADGSHHKALKAPGEDEPLIPGFVELVIVVAGLSSLNKSLDVDSVQRPTIFGRLGDLGIGEKITPLALSKVLTHPNGGLKNIPPKARRVALLNQADTPDLQSQANEIGKMLLPVFDSMVVTSLEPVPGFVFAIKENIAAIILAAGASSRLGLPKQLLDYHGKTFVRVVSETAIMAGCSPVIVVSGSNAKNVSAAVEDLPLTIVHNPDWKDGQSTSVKVGLGQLPGNVGGAIFLLVDQPQVNLELLHALVERHSLDLPPILAPYVFDQRATPILFDRDTFTTLLTITGDTGGRAIFSKFSPSYLKWFDRRLLLDVDTPEDYEKLLNSELT